MLYELHLLGAILTAAVSAVTAIWVGRETDDRAGRAMVVLLAIHTLMGVLLAVELVASAVLVMKTAAYLSYWLILVAPVVWLLFSIYYTGRDAWLTQAVRALFAVSVAVPSILLATNPFHRAVIGESWLVTEPFVYLAKSVTPLGMVVLGLLYLYLVVAVALLLRLFLFSRRTYRWQIGGLVAGIAAIVAGMGLTMSDAAPLRLFPYGVYGAAIFGVTVAVSLFRTRLFAVAPLARDRLFESLDDAIVVVDADHRIVDFNAAAEELFDDIGERHSERLDDAYPMLVDEATAAHDGGTTLATEHAATGTETGASAGTEAVAGPEVGAGAGARSTTARDPSAFAASFAQPGRDGERSFRVSTSEISSGGVMRGWALIIRDVSALEQYATDLERKTEQLQQFASMLSHDLRNPVAIAAGFIELELEERELDRDGDGNHDGDTENLEQARDAVERIDEMIGDLVSLTREGEAIDDPAPVVLRSVVEDAWSVSDTGAVDLEVSLSDARILADESRLRTVLENLFRNVADHGGSHVRVGWLDDESSDPKGFYVEDDGPGIRARDRESVFEYGVSKGGGTGLGLAIVAAIADAHGWSVAVTDGTDGGARFEFTELSTP